ncbi:hypothetical protein GCM10008985_05070 [Halococcus dombrowskii]|uniref:Secreted protein n=1 Tax=Halococcus dombrowskii TaxID=179637 RepID=A0AAV3SCL7_HALDO
MTWRLWVWEFLDESGAGARRLVKLFATLRTTVTRDLNFLVRIRSIAPFWLVSGFSTRRAAVSTRLFVVLVPEWSAQSMDTHSAY